MKHLRSPRKRLAIKGLKKSGLKGAKPSAPGKRKKAPKKATRIAMPNRKLPAEVKMAMASAFKSRKK